MNSRYLLLYVFTIITAVSSVYSNPVIDDSLGTQPYTKHEHHDISIPEREHLDPTLLHPARVHARAVVPKKSTKKQPVTQVRKTTTKKQKPGPPLKKTPIEKKPSTTTTTTTTKAKSCPLKPGAKPGEVQKPGTTTPQKQKTNRLAARTLRLSKRTVAKGQKVYDLLQSKRKAKVDKMTLAELKAKFDEKCYFRLPTEGKEAVFDEHIADLVNGGEQLASEEDGWVVSVISNTCNPWTGNPKEKNAQKYANSFHPRNGVIVAQNNDHGEQGTNSGLTWSDLAYMDYADAAAAQDVAVSGLTMVLRDTITNPETKATLSKMRMDGCLKKDINNVAVLTYEQDREYFLELLGSTNGVGVAYLLADFAGSFNGKNIVRVHADTGGMHLVWEIK